VDFGPDVVLRVVDPVHGTSSCSTVPAGPTHHHGRTVSVLVSEGGGFEVDRI